MYLLQTKQLTKYFRVKSGPFNWKKQLAFRGIDLSIQPGEILAIAGESGSGKTTIAKCLAGLLAADNGDIYYQGQNTTETSTYDKRVTRPEIQMIFQNPDLAMNPLHRISRILTEPLIHSRGITKTKALQLAGNAMEEIGLSVQDLNKIPGQLSGGQKQRVAIARTMLLNPKVIIADEPTSSLDEDLRTELMELLVNECVQRNMALILISHDIGLLRQYAQRIAIMREGELVEIVSGDNCKAEYTKALFRAANASIHPVNKMTGVLNNA